MSWRKMLSIGVLYILSIYLLLCQGQATTSTSNNFTFWTERFFNQCSSYVLDNTGSCNCSLTDNYNQIGKNVLLDNMDDYLYCTLDVINDPTYDYTETNSTFAEFSFSEFPAFANYSGPFNASVNKLAKILGTQIGSFKPANWLPLAYPGVATNTYLSCPCRTESFIHINLTIQNLTWSDSLLNPSSAAFVSNATTIETTLLKSFSGLNYSPYIANIRVVEFVEPSNATVVAVLRNNISYTNNIGIDSFRIPTLQYSMYTVKVTDNTKPWLITYCLQDQISSSLLSCSTYKYWFYNTTTVYSFRQNTTINQTTTTVTTTLKTTLTPSRVTTSNQTTITSTAVKDVATLFPTTSTKPPPNFLNTTTTNNPTTSTTTTIATTSPSTTTASQTSITKVPTTAANSSSTTTTTTATTSPTRTTLASSTQATTSATPTPTAATVVTPTTTATALIQTLQNATTTTTLSTTPAPVNSTGSPNGPSKTSTTIAAINATTATTPNTTATTTKQPSGNVTAVYDGKRNSSGLTDQVIGWTVPKYVYYVTAPSIVGILIIASCCVCCIHLLHRLTRRRDDEKAEY